MFAFRTISFSVILGVLALGLAILPSTAQATLSERDLFTAGDGLITFDSDTNLEWLDLTQTQNTAYNTVLGSTFVVDLGFTFADVNDVTALFDNAGAANQNGVFTTGQLADAQNLIDLLGCTLFCGSTAPTAEGFADFDPFSTTTVSRSFVQVNLNTNSGRFQNPGLTAVKGQSNANGGSFLIRSATPIPEPATMLLFGIGLASMAGISRRSKKVCSRTTV